MQDLRLQDFERGAAVGARLGALYARCRIAYARAAAARTSAATSTAASLSEIRAYMDSAFMYHEEMVSRSGLVIEIAGACICAVSKTQELVTKSSTEAELVAISDMSNNILWVRQMLHEMGYVQNATSIMEDNMSTIALLTNNLTYRQSTKHVNLRYFFIRDRIRMGDVTIVYVPRVLQVADMMTKPLDGSQLRKICGYIMKT